MKDKPRRTRDFFWGLVGGTATAGLLLGTYLFLQGRPCPYPQDTANYPSIADAVNDCSERGYRSRYYWLENLTVKKIEHYPDRQTAKLTLTDGESELVGIAIPEKSERRCETSMFIAGLVEGVPIIVPTTRETTHISGTIGWDAVKDTEPGDNVLVRFLSFFPEGEPPFNSIELYFNKSLAERLKQK
jgi:hypothetical protein